MTLLRLLDYQDTLGHMIVYLSSITHLFTSMVTLLLSHPLPFFTSIFTTVLVTSIFMERQRDRERERKSGREIYMYLGGVSLVDHHSEFRCGGLCSNSIVLVLHTDRITPKLTPFLRQMVHLGLKRFGRLRDLLSFLSLAG